MAYDILRAALEIVSIALALGLIVAALWLARSLRRLDDADLAAHMFLQAAATRRFLVQFAVAALFFLILPISSLAYVFFNDDVVMLAHDAGHVGFLAVVLYGLYGLIAAARRQGGPAAGFT